MHSVMVTIELTGVNGVHNQSIDDSVCAGGHSSHSRRGCQAALGDRKAYLSNPVRLVWSEYVSEAVMRVSAKAASSIPAGFVHWIVSSAQVKEHLRWSLKKSPFASEYGFQIRDT